MIYIDPSLEYAKREIDTVESYASNCSDFSLQTLYEALDIFAFAHFWGWLWVQIYAFEIEIQVSWLIKWGASSRWSRLYTATRNSDQMSIEKTHPTLYYLKI